MLKVNTLECSISCIKLYLNLYFKFVSLSTLSSFENCDNFSTEYLSFSNWNITARTFYGFDLNFFFASQRILYNPDDVKLWLYLFLSYWLVKVTLCAWIHRTVLSVLGILKAPTMSCVQRTKNEIAKQEKIQIKKKKRSEINNFTLSNCWSELCNWLLLCIVCWGGWKNANANGKWQQQQQQQQQ